MFLAKTLPSHKLRLSVVVCLCSMVVLGLGFSAVLGWARLDRLHLAEMDLRTAASTLGEHPDDQKDLDELRENFPGTSAVIIDPSGQVLAEIGHPPHKVPDGFTKRHAVVSLSMPTKHGRLVLARSWHEEERTIEQLAAMLFLMWGVLSACSGLVTWAATQSVFRPLNELVAQAEELAAAGGQGHLATTDSAEFGSLVTHLNSMLNAVRETAAREERFAQDAAHELRTPLAILSAQIETTLLRARTPEEYVASHHSLLTQTERLIRLSGYLLMSAKRGIPHAEPLDAVATIERTVTLWQKRFQSHAVSLEFHRGEDSQVRILDVELELILNNLLDNALRYSPADTQVIVQVAQKSNRMTLTVSDEGPGMSQEFVFRAFDRLSREEEGRARTSGGTGLGLSICQRIAHSRGGEMAIQSKPGAGTIVELRLPAAEK